MLGELAGSARRPRVTEWAGSGRWAGASGSLRLHLAFVVIVRGGRKYSMQDRAVLVTGAARRIGAAIARTLHAAGARVVLHCNRSRAEAEALAAALNAARAGSAAVVQGDLTQSAPHTRASSPRPCAGLRPPRRAGEQRFGLLRHAPGLHRRARTGTSSSARNLRAPLFLAQAAAPRLRESRGRHREHRRHPRRAAAEGLRGLFDRQERASRGSRDRSRSSSGPDVRVNGVAPGAILWPDDGDQHSRAEERARIVGANARSSASAARKTSPAR